MKVYFFLAHNRKNAKGLAPVVCRVTSGIQDREDFRTKIFIDPSKWDTKMRMPINNENSVIIRLNNISNKLYKLIANADGELTAREIVELYKRGYRKKPSTVLDVYIEMCEMKLISKAAQPRISPTIDQFKNFTKNLSLSKVKQETIERFYTYLLKDMVQSPHTIYKKLGQLKRIFAHAKSNEYITLSPFVNYRFPTRPKLDPTRLTEDEIKAIAGKELQMERLSYIRDLFLFQCYTGLAYSDIFKFSRDVIIDRSGSLYMSGERQKNGSDYFLPFFPEAQAIAKKYNYTFANKSNQKYNAYIKEIADLCGVNKNLTSHVGRKTFGQLMVDRGYSAESISKMLGHASFDMTQKHYARISEARIENEYLKMNGKN